MLNIQFTYLHYTLYITIYVLHSYAEYPSNQTISKIVQLLVYLLIMVRNTLISGIIISLFIDNAKQSSLYNKNVFIMY